MGYQPNPIGGTPDRALLVAETAVVFLGAGLFVFLLLFFFYSRADLIVVRARTWIREADVEHYDPYTYTTCQASVPSDAKELERKIRAHSHSWTTTHQVGKTSYTQHHSRRDDLVTWERWEWRVRNTLLASGSDPVAVRWPEVKTDPRTRAGPTRFQNILSVDCTDGTTREYDDRGWSLFADSPPGTRLEARISITGSVVSLAAIRAEAGP